MQSLSDYYFYSPPRHEKNVDGFEMSGLSWPAIGLYTNPGPRLPGQSKTTVSGGVGTSVPSALISRSTPRSLRNYLVIVGEEEEGSGRDHGRLGIKSIADKVARITIRTSDKVWYPACSLRT